MPTNIPLKVIPEPAPKTRTVIDVSGEGTLAFAFGGDVVLECGSCGSPLAEMQFENQLRKMVIRCNSCGAFNETLH